MSTPSTGSMSRTTRRLSRALALLGTTALGMAVGRARRRTRRAGLADCPAVDCRAFLPVSKLAQRFELLSWSD